MALMQNSAFDRFSVFSCCGLLSHCLSFLKVAGLDAVAMAADSITTSLTSTLRSSPVK